VVASRIGVVVSMQLLTETERAHPAFDWAIREAIGIACETVKGYDPTRAAWVLTTGAELAGQQHELETLIARALLAAFDRGQL